ncbi:MAG: GGDEF domain-containing protein [Rickettsiales bacterium]
MSSIVDEVKSVKKLSPSRRNILAQRIESLGIPAEEITDNVRLVISALLEKMDDLSRDLSRTKENLSEIERLVDVDCVAPIANRRAFMRRLSWAINMQERYGHPSTILYFDLDDFKAINDDYGHAAGDLAIIHVAQILSSIMRDSDFLARIGGDEFAVIMYYADESSAKSRGKKIAEKLSGTPFIFNGTQLYVKTSYGCYSVRSGDDAESALSSADMSMYVDKRRKKSAVLV